MRPRVVVETGVFDGFSSAFIPKALRDNGYGRLCSIDVPARTSARASTDMMAFELDVFFHDGLHTSANMLREYATTWPARSMMPS